MSLDGVSVVGDCLHKLSLLNIHGLHPESILLFLQLVVHDFLEAHAFIA